MLFVIMLDVQDACNRHMDITYMLYLTLCRLIVVCFLVYVCAHRMGAVWSFLVSYYLVF